MTDDPNHIYGRPKRFFKKVKHYSDLGRFLSPDEQGWRRQHALASLRACLGVLAFACLGVAFLDAEKDLQLLRKLSKIKILTSRPG